MILYQKSRTPYVLRLLPSLLNPGIWILIALAIGLGYLSTKEGPPIVYGMYLADVVLVFFVWIMISSALARSETKIIQIEIVPAGLKVQQVVYDTIKEKVIPASELKLEAITSKGRRDYRVNYYLKISGKDEKETSFVIAESREVIGQFLKNIDAQKLIQLRANEKDFLLSYQSMNLKSVTGRFSSIFGWLMRTALVLGLIFLGYQGWQFWKSISQNKAYPLLGTWQVVNEAGGAGTISFSIDNSFKESVFNSQGNWVFVDDSLTHIAKLSLNPEDTEDRGRRYEIISLTDSSMDVKREDDAKMFRLHKSDRDNYDGSDFDKVIGIFEKSFLTPLSTATEDEWMKKYIVNWQPKIRPRKVLYKDDAHVLCLLTDDGTNEGNVGFLAVFNRAAQTLSNYEEVFQTDCYHSLSVSNDNAELILHYEENCDEVFRRDFRIDERGKLIAMDVTTTGEPWTTNETFATFSRKWYPLFEGANGLERQQLCGSEGFIEIVETGNGFIWREQGYQDVWEAVIQNFEVSGVEVDVYKFIVKHESNTIREINLVFDETHAGAMLFDGRPYTNQLDVFPVNNNTGECL